MNKAKMMEETRDKLKAQKNQQKGITGKRSFGTFKNSKFETGSSSESNKKPLIGKSYNQGQNQAGSGAKKPKCDRCFGPHALEECK